MVKPTLVAAVLAFSCARAPEEHLPPVSAPGPQGVASSAAPFEATELALPEKAVPARTEGWQRGYRYDYRAKVENRVSFGRSTGNADFDLFADVALTPIEASAERVVLALQVANPRFVSRDVAAQAELDRVSVELVRPCFVTLERGLVREARLAAGLSAMAAGVCRGLAAALQFSAPRGGRKAWSSDEYDATGRYDASYETKAANLFAKRKLRYSKLLTGSVSSQHETPEMLPHVRASQGEIEIARGGRPLRVHLVDELDAAHTQLQMQSRIAVTLVAGVETPVEGDGAELRATRASLQPLLASEAYQAPIDRAALDLARRDGKTFAELVSGVDQLALADQSSGAGDDSGSQRLQEDGRLLIGLAATFRQEPGTVAAALDHIRASAPGAQTLISALASSGTPAAQEALAELIRAPGEDPQARHSVVLALTRTPTPSAGSVALLETLLEDPTSGSQALYGLGTFSRRFRDAGDHEAAARIGELLLKRLARADSEFALSRTLRALSNAGYAPALPALRRLLDDAREQVRVDAVTALRLLTTAEADELIGTKLKLDPSKEVRRAAVAAAAVRAPTKVLSSALEQASKDRDTHVRYRATALMVSWLSKQPSLRRTLGNIAARDPEPQVRAAAKLGLEAARSKPVQRGG
jgi:HEAT repeat protein